VSAAEFSDEQGSRFARGGSRGDFEQVRVVPQRLSVDKTDAVLVKIGSTLSFIELEFHHDAWKIADKKRQFKIFPKFFS